MLQSVTSIYTAVFDNPSFYYLLILPCDLLLFHLHATGWGNAVCSAAKSLQYCHPVNMVVGLDGQGRFI